MTPGKVKYPDKNMNRISVKPFIMTFGILLGFHLFIAGQTINQENINQLLTQLQKSQPDTNRIKLLLKTGVHYLLKRGEYRNDLDSASLFFKKALNLSDSLRLNEFRNESLCRLGETYLQVGNLQDGKKYFMQVIKDYQTSGNKEKEAFTWMRMAYTTYRESSTYGYFYSFPINAVNEAPREITNHFKIAGSVYKQVNNKEGEIEALRQVADINLNQGKLDSAETKFLQVLRMYESIGFRNLHYTYDLLSITSRLKGNYNNALLYSIKAINNAKVTGDSSALSHFYIGLAHAYHELGQTEKSIEWYQRALEKFQTDHFLKPNLYRVVGYLTRELIEAGRNKDALTFLSDIRSETPPYSILDKEIAAKSMGDCYNALKQYERAEKYYLEMIAWDEKLQIGGISSEVYDIIGNFYIERQQYDKASIYLKKILELPAGLAILDIIKNTHFLLFKADSASGNYSSAISHHQQYKALNDSIFNSTKSRQIEELQIQYETGKKEQDIHLLSEKSKLQQSQLKQARQTRNITFISIVLLIIILLLLYNQYRIKQRSNKSMSQKNQSLQHLLDEKEWLLKEVHHRVKNNLHTIISLLEAQSAYLEDDALLAVQNSRHRVYAMSLIHQKLYQAGNTANIDMALYLSELINYLRDSFDVKQRIRFSTNIESFQLDISQAIPIGLILNEAITNSIKHAFPGNKTGEIIIGMKQATRKTIILTVADNGIGLSFNHGKPGINSLGMKLMKGLSDDIHATFSIENKNGTMITVEFPQEQVLKTTQKEQEIKIMELQS
jgi:two-component sensor histidine kinase